METPSGPPVREKVHSRSRGGAAARRGGRTIYNTKTKDNASGHSLSLALHPMTVPRTPANVHKIPLLGTTTQETDASKRNHPSMPSNPLIGTSYVCRDV